MKLSIGMIVKNEEKYLEKCLTAIKPILENVDSELIIADTGSTDRTVEIAQKFTDNVFHFEWINDFAAARNSTLYRAKGEWYMFIDADEIFSDCTEMIEFFNSGEYKKYNSATLLIKNYNDMSAPDIFNIYNLHRLTALKDGVCFLKPVHENLAPYFTPVKNFKTVVDHYGYVFKENGKILDVLEEKTSRNLKLLFQELEEGEKNGDLKDTVYGQIADCYIMLDQCEEALRYIDLGMEKCHPESYVKIEYYNKKIRVLNRLGRHKEVIETCKQYFSKDNRVRKGRLVTDSNIYFHWATSSYALGDFDEVINKAALGFDIYRSYHNGKLFTEELNFCGVDITIPMVKQILNFFIISCERQKRYNDAVMQMSNIPMKDFLPDLEFMKSHLSIRVVLMEKTNYNKLPDLYYQLDKPNRAIFENILIRNAISTKQIDHFLKKLSLIANENERLSDIIKLYNSYFIQHDLTPLQTTEFINKYGTKDNEVIWILMMKRNFNIMPFICAEDFDPVNSIDEVYKDVVEADAAINMFNTQMQRLSNEAVDKAVVVFESAVRSATEFHFDTSKIIQIFSQLGKRWTKLNPDKEPPESVVFALELGETSELYRKKRYEDAIQQINKLIENELSKAPAVSEQSNESEQTDKDEQTDESEKLKILRHYLYIVNGNAEKNAKMAEKQNSDPMLVELAAKIKKEIRSMIEQWDLDGAEEALDKMAKLAPFDPDIEDIRDEITDRKINYMNYM